MSTRRTFFLAACLGISNIPLALAAPPSAHLQFERDGLSFVAPPRVNPGIFDPDWGTTSGKERRIVIRDVEMDFKKLGHVQIDVFNNSMDVAQTDAWVEVVDIHVAGGFAKAERGPGLKTFYVQGNGPVVLDLVLRVSNKTRASDLAVKIQSPYGKKI